MSNRPRQLDAVIADYLRRIGRGEAVDRRRFMQAHRELAEELRIFFNDLDCIENLVERHELADEEETGEDITSTHMGVSVPNSFIRLDARHAQGLSAGREFSFGDYELLQELGRGGMGIVFKARQRSLDRVVCIKMMLMAELAEVEEYKRFRAEALAIAQLRHPGIVAIYEVGQHNGTPYYTMEYVDGTPLAKSVTEQPLPAQKAAEYVRQIAAAIHLAHENGIVHRDLKPSNVLVDGQEHVHITDFGVAKHLGKDEDLTVTGQVLGTPSYMSPEQASARRGEIGRGADIYALGAILYALLTGRPPHRADDALETVQQVMTETPVYPRVLNSGIPADLETICMKCLEKSPAARYPTADELAADLQRFLSGRPILARRTSVWGRSRRWMRRHPTATLAAAGAALLVATATALLTVHNSELAQVNELLKTEILNGQRALEIARQNELTARNLQYVSDMQLVEPYAAEGDYRSSIELLRNNRPPPGKQDVRGFEWHVLLQRQRRTGETIDEIETPLYYVCCAHGGDLIATCGLDATVRLYRTKPTAKLLISIPTLHGDINGVAFSFDDALIATAGDDGYVRVWEVATGRMQLEIQAHEHPAFNVAFLRNDSLLLSCGRDSAMRLWHVKDGTRAGALEGPSEAVDAFAVSPGEKSVWSVSTDLFLRRFDLDSQQPIGPNIRHLKRPTCVAVTPNGALVVSGELGEQLVACNAATGKVEIIQTSHPIQSVAVSPDGRKLAAGDRNGAVHLWEIQPVASARCGYTFEAKSGWHAHEGRVYGLHFTHDSQTLMSVGSDGATRSWDVQQLITPDVRHSWTAANSGSLNSFCFIADSPILASANPAQGIELWDVTARSNQPIKTIPLAHVQCVGCSSSGLLIAGGTYNGLVAVWKDPDAPPIFQWDVTEQVAQIAFSPDERYVAVVTWQTDSAFRQTQLYDLSDGAPVFEQPRRNWRHIAFAPDKPVMHVSLDETDHIMQWDLQKHKSIGFFNAHDTTIRHMTISPCGTYIVSVANDRNVLVYNTLTRSESPISTGLKGQTTALLIGPNGASVAIADSLGVVRVCNLRAAKRVVDIVRVFRPGAPSGFALSSDGRYLVGRWDNEFQLFDLLPLGTPRELKPAAARSICPLLK